MAYLIEKCRHGDRTAQLTLYRHYSQRLYATCLRIIGNPSEAEEAMQDAFLKIFTHLEQYREEVSFEAWMRRIALHTAVDYVRRMTPDLETFSDNCLELAVDEADDEADEEQVAYSVARVKDACKRLPPGYRVILSLYLFEGYDMEEIASILKIQPSSVRSQYLRGKRKLLELLETLKEHG